MQIVIDARAENAAVAPPKDFIEILSAGQAGAWILNLPEPLRKDQRDLEALLGHVFGQQPRTQQNFELAQQMTINWCISKFRKLGLRPHDTEWL